jgi:hypothetical protein
MAATSGFRTSRQLFVLGGNFSDKYWPKWRDSTKKIFKMAAIPSLPISCQLFVLWGNFSDNKWPKWRVSNKKFHDGVHFRFAHISATPWLAWSSHPKPLIRRRSTIRFRGKLFIQKVIQMTSFDRKNSRWRPLPVCPYLVIPNQTKDPIHNYQYNTTTFALSPVLSSTEGGLAHPFVHFSSFCRRSSARLGTCFSHVLHHFLRFIARFFFYFFFSFLYTNICDCQLSTPRTRVLELAWPRLHGVEPAGPLVY